MKKTKKLLVTMSLGLGFLSAPQFTSAEATNNYVPEDFNQLAIQDTWPVPDSTRITQDFIPGDHYGVDIGASTPGVAGDGIVAFYYGTVNKAGWSSSYGWVVYIDHTIEGNSWQSRYAHMSKAPVVSTNAAVYSGQYIGNMGNTGDSDGVHLHFETRINGYAVDPIAYFFSEYSLASDNSKAELYDAEEWDLGEFYTLEEINEMTTSEKIEKGIPLD